MHTKKELDQKLQSAGLVPHKKLGQNFLVNPSVCTRIISSCREFDFSTLVEIGPGLGALTDDLISLGAKTLLIEYDRGMVQYWEKEIERRNLSQLQIIHEDALQFSWEKLNEQGGEFRPPRLLVSNLPYSIAGSLVIDLSGAEVFEGLVLMFQKEVAERILSDVGSEDYGFLSVVAQSYWDIAKVIDAGPQDFHPVPHVGSRVLKFKARKTNTENGEPLKNAGTYKKFIKQAFSQRRKKLSSNLGALFSKDMIVGAFIDLQLVETTRAQDLSPEQFIKIFKNLSGEK